MKGSIGAFTMKIEVGGANEEWHRDIVFRKEWRVEDPNQEAKNGIKAAEEK